jgi:hypothetical protein
VKAAETWHYPASAVLLAFQRCLAGLKAPEVDQATFERGQKNSCLCLVVVALVAIFWAAVGLLTPFDDGVLKDEQVRD